MPPGPGERPPEAEFLSWYVEMGADEAHAPAPVDRYRASAQAPVPPTAPASPLTAAAPPAAPAPPPSAAAPPAASVAAATIEELQRAVEAFDGCDLKRTAQKTVFADGAPESGLMLIGEGPGADEDRVGRPFVGKAGQLLDRMLAAIGRDRRTGAYITNIVFWRPPGNRAPTDEETEACRPFVLRHIALVRPRAVVLLGASAAKALLRTSEGITRLRGRWQELDVEGLEVPVPVLPTFHPAFLLRQPMRKREAWADLQALRARLEEAGSAS